MVVTATLGLLAVLVGGVAVASRLDLLPGTADEAGAPNGCDAGCDEDPQESSPPEDSSTGVPAGTDLVDTEPGTFDEDGLVLDGVTISGDVLLTGSDQTLRNSRVDGHVIVRGTDVTLEDSELGALSISGAQGVVASRLEIFGLLGSDGFHVTSDVGPVRDVVIEDSWVHSPSVTPESHYDGIQVRGVQGLEIRGNYFDLGPWEEPYTSAILLQQANGGNSDVLIDGNWIDGGGFALYVGGADVVVTNNKFGRNANWGLLHGDADPFTEEGNTWADTGEAVTLQ